MKSKYISKNIIALSKVQFGTSGARGLIADFSNDVCVAFTHSFLTVVEQKFSFTSVALAIDNRPSSYEIAQACAFAIKQHGWCG